MYHRLGLHHLTTGSRGWLKSRHLFVRGEPGRDGKAESHISNQCKIIIPSLLFPVKNFLDSPLDPGREEVRGSQEFETQRRELAEGLLKGFGCKPHLF